MKKVLLSVLTSCVAIAAVRADLIWHEGFQYADGLLTTNSAGTWIRSSGTGNDMFVYHTNLEVAATGGSPVTRQDDNRRPLATVANSPYTNTVQVLYASFTVICTNLPNGAGSYFASFYNPATGNGGGYFGRVQAFTNGTALPNTWRLGATANALATNPANGGYPVDLALNTPYRVVEELDPVSLQAATIWVNPIVMSQTGSSPTETHYTSSDALNFGTSVPVTDYAFRQASSFGNAFFQITNLALATTFAEAATNFWGTNALAPTVVYQPAGVSNFVGSSISLFAVANGQGLGALTYQWQKSASPANSNPSNVSNPNGNTNTLSFASAQSTDSGYYTLVVTTPYGLSATSAVARVLISTAPVPPSFVTQPTSQAVYAGQSVSFSTTVVSPGNVTFTWYSNNVIITDGVSSTASSSSLQINNVTPSAAGSYKVAVTNDVVANGIVSSNAVLTIQTPAAVSIAYLRRLVDPATYLPTNVPPSIPYQATGIVTTYTNITSGNTSSYYLQDGTAGINIFVTGGTTAGFRPQQGDVVTFVGVLSSFDTGLELYADANPGSVYPYTSFTILSNNIAALPAPISIPYTVLNDASNANYNLGGSLVRISDVHFGARGGTTTSTTANDNVVVTNSSGQTFNLLFPYLDLDIAGQTLPNYAYSVSGVLYSSGRVVTNTILVTRFADIITNAPSAASVTITRIAGTTISYSGGAGSQFVLLSSPSVTASRSGWSRIRTNSATPGTFTIPAVGSSAQAFYSIKSE